MFGEPGAEILYPDPGFPIYRSMIEFTGATPVPIPIREQNGFAFSADETLQLITPQTRLIIVNSPANPTGGVTPKEDVDTPGRRPRRASRDVAILSDEIYGQMTYDGLPHVSLLAYPEIRDRLILLDGWSKTYAMTGWRMGYSVWPKPLYDHVRKLAVNAWSCVNAPAQYAGLAALTGPQDSVGRMVGEFDKRRKIVVEELNKLPGVSCITPKGAFYAFPNVLEHRLQGEGTRLAAIWRKTASPPSAAPTSASSARAISACPTPTRRRTSARPSAGWRSSWRGTTTWRRSEGGRFVVPPVCPFTLPAPLATRLELRCFRRHPRELPICSSRRRACRRRQALLRRRTPCRRRS